MIKGEKAELGLQIGLPPASSPFIIFRTNLEFCFLKHFFCRGRFFGSL